ncbi:hypothetical protein FOVSG1_008218 [Fusarium oxysporum f. sp. vasinfectum]
MPSSKVFAAILAALAMADASPCKPKPVTTSGSTAAVVTTSGSTDILSSTATTETAATTTTGAACSHYTPYTDIVPADCGKTGVAPSCADKVIGSPITVTDYAQCGNTCGMTVGCKSFSIKGSSCTLYKAPVSSLGYVFNEGSDASHFYDLDLCFGCGEGTTTSGTETITGSQTTGTEAETSATGSATETTGTASAGTTTATGSETETSATGSETGTTTATESETETSGTAHATGTTDTETSATGSQTETTTAPGATTETSATETLTANTDTTTAAATTTTSAGCTAYTPVANPPSTNCAVRGAPSGLSAFFNNLAGLGNSNTADCARSCGVYHDTTKPNDKCVSFALDASNTCYLYKVPISSLNVGEGSPVLEFYDFEACYSCDEGGATTTAAGADTTTTETGSETGTTTTEAGADTTTTETGSETGTTTTEAGADTTTTETGSETGTTTTEAGAGSTTTTEAGSDTTTTAAGVDTTTTEAGSDTTTTTAAGVDTTATTTTEAASTTTDSVCTGYTPVPNPPSASCAVKGKSYKTYISTDTGSSADVCASKCSEVSGCKSFAYKASSSTCTFYTQTVSELQINSCASAEESEFYEFEICYAGCGQATTTTEAAGSTTTTEAGVETTATTTTEAGEGSTTTTEAAVASTTTTEAGEASTTTTEAPTTTTTEAQSTTEAPTTTTAAPVCTNYVPLPNAPSTCGKQGKVSCRSTQKLGQATSVTDVNACGKLCGTTLTCKTFSYTPKFRSAGGYCQLYSAPLSQLSFTPCNTGVKFYDLDTCYTCSNTPTPTPPATCSKYVPAFEKCAKDTHCGTSGEICQEEKINVAGDASCLENCAKSCIDYGKDCKYFSYQPAFYNSAAKCKLYKSGKITKKSTSWVKFYEQDCFKCQQSK